MTAQRRRWPVLHPKGERAFSVTAWEKQEHRTDKSAKIREAKSLYEYDCVNRSTALKEFHLYFPDGQSDATIFTDSAVQWEPVKEGTIGPVMLDYVCKLAAPLVGVGLCRLQQPRAGRSVSAMGRKGTLGAAGGGGSAPLEQLSFFMPLLCPRRKRAPGTGLKRRLHARGRGSRVGQLLPSGV